MKYFKLAPASREGGQAIPTRPLLRVYFLGNYGWYCFKYGVVVVIYCLYCLAFSLALTELCRNLEDHRLTLGCSPFHAMIYGYVYIIASSERILAYYTAFKLCRRAFDASAN